MNYNRNKTPKNEVNNNFLYFPNNGFTHNLKKRTKMEVIVRLQIWTCPNFLECKN